MGVTEGTEATAAEQREAIRKGGEQIARWRASSAPTGEVLMAAIL